MMMTRGALRGVMVVALYFMVFTKAAFGQEFSRRVITSLELDEPARQEIRRVLKERVIHLKFEQLDADSQREIFSKELADYKSTSMAFRAEFTSDLNEETTKLLSEGNVPVECRIRFARAIQGAADVAMNDNLAGCVNLLVRDKAAEVRLYGVGAARWVLGNGLGHGTIHRELARGVIAAAAASTDDSTIIKAATVLTLSNRTFPSAIPSRLLGEYCVFPVEFMKMRAAYYGQMFPANTKAEQILAVFFANDHVWRSLRQEEKTNTIRCLMRIGDSAAVELQKSNGSGQGAVDVLRSVAEAMQSIGDMLHDAEIKAQARELNEELEDRDASKMREKILKIKELAERDQTKGDDR